MVNDDDRIYEEGRGGVGCDLVAVFEVLLVLIVALEVVVVEVEVVVVVAVSSGLRFSGSIGRLGTWLPLELLGNFSPEI